MEEVEGEEAEASPRRYPLSFIVINVREENEALIVTSTRMKQLSYRENHRSPCLDGMAGVR